jgi:glycine/D-amino acid oxidase-like deaminating enzyme
MDSAGVADFTSDGRPPSELDFAIVGGGLAGLSTAIRLKEAEPGARVAVIEAYHVGFGASGRNGGLMSPLPAPVWLVSAEENIEHAWALGWLHRKVAETAGWLSTIATSADVRPETLRLQASGPVTACALAEISRTLSASGIEHALVDGEGRRCAIELAAHTVHPMRLVRALARYAQELGVTVHENVAVEQIAPEAERARLVLAGGDSVIAGRAIVASNAYTTRALAGEKVAASVVHNYMMATSVERTRTLQPFVVELNHAYAFYREHAGSVVYGGIERFREAEGGPYAVPRDVLAGLGRLMEKSLGRRPGAVSHAWGGRYHQTANDLPVIRSSRHSPAIILNVGYGGTGVAMTTVCASVTAAVALGGRYRDEEERRFHDVMTRTRVPVRAGAKFAARVAGALVMKTVGGRR